MALEQRLLTGTSSFEREIRNFQEAEGIELLYVRQEKLHRVRVMPHKSDRISTDGESRPVATGNFSGDLRNSQGLGLQAAETANAVGQAVLEGSEQLGKVGSSRGRASQNRRNRIPETRTHFGFAESDFLFAVVVHSYG